MNIMFLCICLTSLFKNVSHVWKLHNFVGNGKWDLISTRTDVCNPNASLQNSYCIYTISMMKTQCGVMNVQFACLISGSCVCAWVFVWEGEGGRLRESVCLIMADGSSDDDVIHLASFNTHRGRGTNIEPLFWRILSTLLEVIVVFWAFWPLFCFMGFSC